MIALSSEYIGFTGSSKPLAEPQRKSLLVTFSMLHDSGAIWLNNGDCINGDFDAALYWRALGGKLHLHPPLNPSKRAFLTGDFTEELKEYLDRNKKIVDKSCLMVGAPHEKTEQLRSGTWSTIRYARHCGVPIITVFPDGSVLQTEVKDAFTQ